MDIGSTKGKGSTIGIGVHNIGLEFTTVTTVGILNFRLPEVQGFSSKSSSKKEKWRSITYGFAVGKNQIVETNKSVPDPRSPSSPP